MIKDIYVVYLVLFVMLWRCIYTGRFNTFYSIVSGSEASLGSGHEASLGSGNEASLGSGNEASLGSGNKAGMLVTVHWL